MMHAAQCWRRQGNPYTFAFPASPAHPHLAIDAHAALFLLLLMLPAGPKCESKEESQPALHEENERAARAGWATFCGGGEEGAGEGGH